jgi:hypothetical protein
VSRIPLVLLRSVRDRESRQRCFPCWMRRCFCSYSHCFRC